MSTKPEALSVGLDALVGRVQFVDQSAAPPLEKARRVLRGLASMDRKYFYDDGFPRNAIGQDATAVLAVLECMARETPNAGLNRPGSRSEAEAGGSELKPLLGEEKN